MKKFNVKGTCIPTMHYTVDLTNKLKQIKEMIDEGDYFTINRGRQYGKTTVLFHLRQFLADEYTVIPLSFEGLGQATFESEKKFCETFLIMITDVLEATGHSQEEQNKWANSTVKDFWSLGRHIRDVCKSSENKYVLMIDEVDKASNNIVFLDLLSKLRDKYLKRNEGIDFTFQSVILASVYDIKNIKLKMIREGTHIQGDDETSTQNSPWNIAADFKVEMSFSAVEIETMLNDYESDYQTGMPISDVASEIYRYTRGYPVLVSRICKYIDEEFEKNWSLENIWKSIRFLIKENSPLFESLINNLKANSDLSRMTYDILMLDGKWLFTYDNPSVALGVRYGYLTELDNRVAIANSIFQMRMTNFFISEDKHRKNSVTIGFDDQTDIIQNGRFDMVTCLEKFAKYYHEHYSHKDIDFLHDQARYLVLFFLNPILNGKGFVHNEDQFRDGRKMDLVVTYLNQLFIIELKIWRGEKRHHDGYEQLIGYMDKKNLNEGYLLTFDFNQKKQTGSEWIEVANGHRIFDIKV